MTTCGVFDQATLKLSCLYRQNDQIAEVSEQTCAVFGRKEGEDGHGRLMIFQHIAEPGR